MGATSSTKDANEQEKQDELAKRKDRRVGIIVVGRKDSKTLLVIGRDTKTIHKILLAGMGMLVNLAPLYGLVHITTRGISLESLVIVDKGGIRESPRWL